MISEFEPRSDASTYLLNGLPALLARRVLEQILCFEPRARVFAIVHTDDIDFAERIVKELDVAQASRVSLLTGDLTALDFGLGGREYMELARWVHRVHHVVTPGTVYVDAANQALVGAALGRELVEFGRAAAALKSLVIHSSVGVSGDRSGTVMEDDLVHGQAFSNSFDQALALMECIVRRAKDQLPALVVRPALLSGDSQTGECERTSPLYQLVEAMLALPAAQPARVPNDRSPVHLVATDYVARAAYYLGRRADTVGHTFHLTDAHPTELSHVIRLLLAAAGHPSRDSMGAGLGPRVQPPMSEWARACAKLRGPAVYYDARRAQEVLGPSTIACPAFEDYADKLVDFVRGRQAQKAR